MTFLMNYKELKLHAEHGEGAAGRWIHLTSEGEGFWFFTGTAVPWSRMTKRLGAERMGVPIRKSGARPGTHGCVGNSRPCYLLAVSSSRAEGSLGGSAGGRPGGGQGPCVSHAPACHSASRLLNPAPDRLGGNSIFSSAWTPHPAPPSLPTSAGGNPTLRCCRPNLGVALDHSLFFKCHMYLSVTPSGNRGNLSRICSFLPVSIAPGLARVLTTSSLDYCGQFGPVSALSSLSLLKPTLIKTYTVSDPNPPSLLVPESPTCSLWATGPAKSGPQQAAGVKVWEASLRPLTPGTCILQPGIEVAPGHGR